MNTHFEMISTGNEFETASEEFERGYRSRGGTSRYAAQRWRQQQQQRRAPQRPGWGYGQQTQWPAWAGPGSRYQQCVQQCLAAPYDPTLPYPVPAIDPTAPDPGPDAPSGEIGAHPYRCHCAKCAGAAETFEFAGEGEGEGEGEAQGEGEGEYEFAGEGEGESEAAGPFSEAEEIALAAELLSVSNEAELEQFLGKLWSSVKKVGSVVGNIAKPFSGVLKAVAKKALPFVGGALGSFIPIPGVGTALGTALGSAVGNALEMEFEGLELEDREFEMARRFVRIAGSAAQQLGPQIESGPAVQDALSAAARQHLPHFRGAGGSGPHAAGRWTRRGSTLVLSGV